MQSSRLSICGHCQPNHRQSGTHHAGCLHGLAQAGSIGLAPEHVAGKVSRPLRHDEGESVDVLPHAHKGEETHATLTQDFLRLGWREAERRSEGRGKRGEEKKERERRGDVRTTLIDCGILPET